jgi:hypothetical protein
MVLDDHTNALKMLKEYLAANPQRVAAYREDPGWMFKDLVQNPQFKQLVGAK